MAALAAARDGADVIQVWRAPGATALALGALRVAADLDHLDAGHPLAALGDRVRLGIVLDEAVGALQSGLRTAGLPLEGSRHHPGLYADLHGRPWPGALVPATIARGELGALRGRRVAVVGVPAVSEYDAASTAGALRELSGVDAFPVEVEMEGVPPGGSLSDLFGRPAPALGRLKAEAAAFPPGLSGLPESAFELLAGAPSPHGWQLHQALERMVAAAGVHRRRGAVAGFERAEPAGEGEPARLRSAVVDGEEVALDAVVLATGRYIGGGLTRGRRAAEPLLGLEVHFEGAPASASARLPRLLDLDSTPAFREGVRTDEELRPLDEGGRPAFANLRAAGALLAGWDADGPDGMGVPILTGWLAGRWSARA